MPVLETAAVVLYETVRRQVLAGQACQEAHATFRFHGMVQALRVLLKSARVPTPLSQAPSRPTLGCNPDFVRLLADFVLRTYAESAHAC